MKTFGTLAVTAALLAMLARDAAGCGYHGALGDNFTALHPRSIEVAVALREAADAGKIDSEILAPKNMNLFGYHRAVRRLQQLGDALTASLQSGTATSAFTLLLVEAALWTRYVPEGPQVRTSVHADGPQDNDVVVVTGEAALAAIEAGTLSADEAFRDGLIVVSGAQGRVAAVTSALAAAIARFAMSRQRAETKGQN